ncbi:MAG: fibronectin type III domain-containing protein [Victivallales bacterium]|jgi:hypothetical protein|nr:fibronectin type III domain-containing protein [Victivallales bacterium]
MLKKESQSTTASESDNPSISVKGAVSGDAFVSSQMPEAEYMYGCAPTAIGMILGYYDLYGYAGKDYSALIEGIVDLNSRGSDGNIYNMNEFNVLGSFIASREHVERFYSRNGSSATTPEQELPYSFVGGGYNSGVSQIDISLWDCLSDYLGTNQYWRGNGDFSTTYHYDMTLQQIINRNSTVTFRSGSEIRSIDWRYTTMLYGLNLYIESCGYSFNAQETGSFRVDSYGGSFTFEDYMREIDADRPVLISIEGHAMTGYGYNEATREIIFDDTYNSGQRMTWGGSYYYSGEYRELLSITVLSLEGGGVIPELDSESPQLNGTPTVLIRGETVTIRWSPATDNVGVEGYILRIGQNEYTLKETSYTLRLSTGVYNFTVLAYDAKGNRSNWSEEQSFTISDLQTPQFNSAPKANVSGRGFTIYWQPADDNIGIAGYVVKLNGEEYEVKEGNSLAFKNQKLGTYVYQVKAYDYAGNYVWSVSRSFKLEEKDIGVYFELLAGMVYGTQSVVLGDVALKPGKYQLGGDFDNFSGKITVVNLANNKKSGSATVKNGVLNFKKPLLLDGNYRVLATGNKNAAGSFSVELSGEIFYRNDNSDDSIAHLKSGQRIEVNTAPMTLITNEWVGFGDEFDYRAITLDYAGKYSFDLSSSDATKLTIWSMQPNGKLKSVKKVSAKAGQSVSIANRLLSAGTYYISVQSSNAKKGGNASYSVRLNNSTAFFTRGDNSDDSIGQLKSNRWIAVSASPISLIADEWVGFSDEFDYRAITLDYAGKYSFDLSSSDATKLTIWSMQPSGKLKSVKKISAKAGQSVSIANLLLSAGTYYISVQSSNAKKGGNASYSVRLNNSTVFFTRGDNSDDNPMSLGEAYHQEIDEDSWHLIANNWVGYGDAIDYRELAIKRSGLYTFSLSGVTDTVKLTLFTDGTNGKLKKLKSVSVKSGGGSLVAQALDTHQRYFVAIESTKAKKGGYSAYNLDVSFELPPPTANAIALNGWQDDTATTAFELEYEKIQLDGLESSTATAEKFSLFDASRRNFEQLA